MSEPTNHVNVAGDRPLKGDVQAAVDAGIMISEAAGISAALENADVPVALLPAGRVIESLEKYKDRPTRKRGRVRLDTVNAFCRFVNKHKVAQETEVFVVGNNTTATFTAVFNYHRDTGQAAGWGDFRAEFTPVPTEEWKRWSEKNKQTMTQEQFALFLEDNLANVVNPAGSELLEIAKKIEAKHEASFGSGIRLENGNVQLLYTETTEARAGEKGTLEIPSMITLGMRLFEGGEAYRLEARFRYRLTSGKLVLWYELANPHLVLQDAIKTIKEAAAEEIGVTPLEGAVV